MDKLEKVQEKITELEDEYNIKIFARGGSYGSCHLIILDSETKEEIMVE